MKSNLRLFAAAAVAMGLFSCSKDEIPNVDPGILGNAETYTTISIAMPNSDGSRASRATTDYENGDGTEIGIGNENAFNSVALYFFNGSDVNASECLGVLNLPGNSFTSKTEGDKVIYKSGAQNVGIEGTDLPVYAVVNGSVPAVAKGTKLSTFLNKTVATSNAIVNGESGALSYLLMTSRNAAEVSISAAANGTEDKAAELSVSVERTAAKIDFKSNGTNEYVVNKEGEPTTKMADVTITDYKIVNLRNDAYFFRKVGDGSGNWTGTGDGEQGGNNYVIDPKFADKTAEAAKAKDFWAIWFGADKAYATNPTDYTALPKAEEPTLLTYCMENTMAQTAQLNGYSTGIIFKAIYKPVNVSVWDTTTKEYKDENYNGGNFYRYDNMLFKSIADVTAFYGTEVTDQIETFTATAEEGKTGAVCYYQYWIRHQNNNDNNNMGIMEFAIVRNNAYKLDIESVSSLGEPTGDIDPENPDETAKMYLKVNVTILPWVVRNNSIEL